MRVAASVRIRQCLPDQFVCVDRRHDCLAALSIVSLISRGERPTCLAIKCKRGVGIGCFCGRPVLRQRSLSVIRQAHQKVMVLRSPSLALAAAARMPCKRDKPCCPTTCRADDNGTTLREREHSAGAVSSGWIKQRRCRWFQRFKDKARHACQPTGVQHLKANSRPTRV